MYTVDIQTQLHGLRPGDRISYNSVDWAIEDYSTYQDPKGYQTDEWLLKSQSGSEYYLLREYDSTQELTPVTWYISNHLQDVHLYLPDSQEDIVPRLWQEMQALSAPYPELKLFYKSYYFESQTEGSYDSEGKAKSRITWDYWDQDHLTNLAIEAFSNRQLDIYSTKIVQPKDFYKIKKGVGKYRNSSIFDSSKGIELILALSLLIGGILLIIFG